MSELATIEHRNGTAIITLRRASKRNALSRELIVTLTQHFTTLATDDTTRAIILTGDGPAFCAGMDLTELQESLSASEEIIWQDAVALAQLFQLIFTHPKPTIAAINGSAVAGGAGLVTVCDLAVSVPTAKFGYPEVRRGLVAALVMPHLLRHVGERAARQLLLTGELIDSSEAKRIGLINDIAPPEMLMPHALQWASQCADGGPLALATTKTLLTQMTQQAMNIDDLAHESATPRLGAECRAGLHAFFNQERPPWQRP